MKQKNRFSISTAPQGQPERLIIGHLYEVGQRVYRRTSISAKMTFGEPRQGTIVDLTWKEQNNGNYPSYTIKFDNSGVVDKTVLQMRIRPIES